jgi:hypothetical protein
MATQGSEDNLVESIEIPSSIKDIYTAACRNDHSIAESLSIPSDRISATLLVQGPGREVIAKIEELSLVRSYGLIPRLGSNIEQNSPTRKERRLEKSGIRPALQVFSPGVNIVGQPYMAIIPFYIKGKVTLGEEEVQMDRYYHAYGKCRLVVEDQSKLGVWAYKLGN